jgi:hypothetical protein
LRRSIPKNLHLGPQNGPEVKTAKNSKLPKLLENCFEPVGKGGWPPISTWIKEMFVILHRLYLWCPYLFGKHFQIKIDHRSLKYFLEQIISSSEKKKWVTKLFGYDYEIIYKKGKENVLVDALSRKYEE